MNREIKFRGWDDDEKVMFDAHWWNVDELNGAGGRPVMQFTGLFDQNGKEIYEGDIVRTRHKGNQTVQWKFLPSDEGIEGIEGYGFEDYGDVKIIGNIYENPELL